MKLVSAIGHVTACSVLLATVATAVEPLDRHTSLQLNLGSHTSDVRALAFVGDSVLCSGGVDKRVLVWQLDAHRGRPRLEHQRTLRWDVEQGNLGAIYALDVAPNAPQGPVAVFAGISSRGGGSELTWSGVDDGRQYRYVNGSLIPGTGNAYNAITSLTITGDGKYTVATDLNLKTVVWSDDAEARLISEVPADARPQLRNPLGRPTCSSTIAGDMVILPEHVRTHALPDGSLRYPVWRLARFALQSGERLEPLGQDELHVAVTAISASRDGRWVAAADYGSNGTGLVHVWNVADGRHQQYEIGDGYGLSLSFSDDGRVLAIGTEGVRGRPSRLIALAVPEMRVLPATQPMSAAVVSCAVSATGRWIAAALDGSSEIFLTSSGGDSLQRIGGGPQVTEGQLAAGESATALFTLAADSTGLARSVAFDPVALRLQTIPLRNRSPQSADPRGWQLTTTPQGRLEATYRNTKYLDVPLPGQVTHHRWMISPDNRLQGILVGTAHGEIFAYTLRARNYVRRFAGHSGAITDLAVSANQQLLLSTSTDGTVRYWSLDGWNTSAVVELPAIERIASRWGITPQIDQGQLLVSQIDDRCSLFHQGLAAGDRMLALIWDDAAASLGLGETVVLEGRPRQQATSPDDMLKVLESIPRDVQVAFRLARANQTVTLPVQSIDSWRELLAVYVQDPHWIAWHPSGYYASSPGGERLIGWLVNGKDQLDEQGNADPSLEKPAPTFHLAIQFREALYRPDVVRQIVRQASLERALKLAEAARAEAEKQPEQSPPERPDPPDQPKPDRPRPDPAQPVDPVEPPPQDAAKRERPARPKRVVDILPPRVRILQPSKLNLETEEPTIVIEAEAIADSRRPVTSMRLMINSSPNNLTVRELSPDMGIAQRGLIREIRYPAQRWEVTLGEGAHELVVRADCGNAGDATYGLSEKIQITYRNARASMYVLAIGISEYPESLKLRYADSDATRFAQTLQTYAAGPDRPYDRVETKLISNRDATRQGILEGFAWLKSQLKMGDLGIIFFAGHGLRENNQFYLAPVDVDLKNLDETAISEAIIKQFCDETNGGSRRLLVVDACHAGALNPAEAFRDLSSDDFGVFVMTSSKDDELSYELDDLRGGVFTTWLNRGLAGGACYGDAYVDDIDLGKFLLVEVKEFVKSRIQRRQTPIVQRPLTSAPFPLTKPLD